MLSFPKQGKVALGASGGSFSRIQLSGLSIERLAQALLDDSQLLGSGPIESEIESILVSIAFRTLVPKDLAGLSVDKILAFRDKYPGERMKFQAAAERFLGDRDWLNKISDRRDLEERLHDECDKVWTSEVGELREKFKEVGIDTVWSCASLKATLPAGLASWMATLGLTVNPIVAGPPVWRSAQHPSSVMRAKPRKRLSTNLRSPTSIGWSRI